MDKITLLSYKQIFGEDKLNIFNKINASARITDFAVLLGGVYDANTEVGCYWIKANKYNLIIIDGIRYHDYTNQRGNGIRPVVSYSKIKYDISNEKINDNGVKEVEYGEYPQYAVNKELQEKLEELYKNNELTKTNKTYTTDSRKYDEFDKDFLPQEHIEYEFDDKKYVRVKVNSYYDGKLFTLSNGEEYKDDDYVWVEVSKVKWLIDKENDVALSKDILVSGIQFDNIKYSEGVAYIENTNMYRFLNIHFIYDIQCTSKISKNYKQVMALIEKEKRRYNSILDKSIIDKTLIKHL